MRRSITAAVSASGGTSASPALTLVVSTSTADYDEAGDTITYAYAVTNAGNVPLESITVTDDTATTSGTIASLEAGATDSTTITGSYTTDADDVTAGSVTNLATAGCTYGGDAVASSADGVTINYVNPARYGIVFDGDDAIANFGNILSFEYNTPFSVAFWIKRQSDGYADLVAKRNSSVGWTVGLTGFPSAQKPALVLYSSSSYYLFKYTTSGTIVSKTTWYHVGVTHDGSGTCAGVKFFIGGTEETSTTDGKDTLGTHDITNADDLLIGAQGDGAGGIQDIFEGQLFDVRVWGKELSEAQIASAMDPDTDVETNDLELRVAYEKGTYPNVPDASGNDRHGTAEGSDDENFWFEWTE